MECEGFEILRVAVKLVHRGDDSKLRPSGGLIENKKVLEDPSLYGSPAIFP